MAGVAGRVGRSRVAVMPRLRELRALAGRHPVFVAMLTLAALLRAVVALGYRNAMWFNDSYDYVETALRLEPHLVRPIGYSLLLWLLRPFHSFAVVVTVQHLMGLAVGVMIYAVLRRRFRLPTWAAALAAAPSLFDAYQIQLEHLVLSDTLFTFLLVLAVTIALWKRTWSIRGGLALGLLFGLVTVVRSIGLPLLAVLLVYLLVRRVGWRTVTAAVAGCAVPLAGYALWFSAVHGEFTMTTSGGPFLYARVMKFADCAKINPPAEEIALCLQVPVEKRGASQLYVWWRWYSPLRRVPGNTFSPEVSRMAGDFAKRAILAQPGDYLQAVGYDVYRVFRWDRRVFPEPITYGMYEFGTRPLRLSPAERPHLVAYEQGRPETRVVAPFADVARIYQDHVFLRGTLLGALLLAGLVGLVLRWRRFGGAALLPWAAAAALLVTPAATAEFDYRYVLPAIPFAAIAAALAGRDIVDLATRRRRRAASADQPGLAPIPTVPISPGAILPPVRPVNEPREQEPVPL